MLRIRRHERDAHLDEQATSSPITPRASNSLLARWARDARNRKHDRAENAEIESAEAVDIRADDVAQSERLGSEVSNQFYAHGGFMGAAPEMLRDPLWNQILKQLMPDVYVETHAAIEKLAGRDGTAPSAVTKYKTVIPMFENNPVMAAYGTWKTGELDRESARKNDEAGMKIRRTDRTDALRAFEWDAFLPPDAVEGFNDAAPQQRPAFARQIAEQMLIAHGTKTQTVFETGIFGLNVRQYDYVRKTAKTNYGGVTPGEWMSLFGRALEMARGDSPDDGSQTEDRQQPHAIGDARMSPKEAIEQFRHVFGGDRMFSVVLDIKSRDATPDVLRALTRELNDWGVHVAGFGSFDFSEIDGVDQQEQIIDGAQQERAAAIKFLHMAGSLQEGIANSSIGIGDHVMFNASSLLSFDHSAKGNELRGSYSVNWHTVDELKVLANLYRLKLGVYVQEPDIDAHAVDTITHLTNLERETFKLGFAWGGLADRASAGVVTGNAPRVGFGGQENPLVADWWARSTPETARASLRLWAANSSVPLGQQIHERTGIQLPELHNVDVLDDYPTLTSGVRIDHVDLRWAQQSSIGDVDASIMLVLIAHGEEFRESFNFRTKTIDLQAAVSPL